MKRANSCENTNLQGTLKNKSDNISGPMFTKEVKCKFKCFY